MVYVGKVDQNVRVNGDRKRLEEGYYRNCLQCRGTIKSLPLVKLVDNHSCWYGEHRGHLVDRCLGILFPWGRHKRLFPVF